MNTKFEISKEFLSSLQWIRLDDLFNLPYEELPSWVWTSNVVYYCRNTHNGKGYVGETKQCLVNRWRGNTIMSHQLCINDSDSIIYRALRKYTSNKFILTILQSNFDSDSDRKSSEIYWIKLLHTHKSEYGYNMTRGGDSTDHLNSPGVRKRRDASDRLNHNGKLAINSEESINRSLSTRTKLYGNPCAFMNTPEVQERALKTNLLNSPNGDPYYMIHTPEVARKIYNNAVINNGGVHPWHSREAIIKKSHMISITKLFISIINKINKLKSNNLNINFKNYSSYVRSYHLDRVKEMIPHLIKDPRWTPEMTEIFKDYIPKDLASNDA
jgi:hypothetical protein